VATLTPMNTAHPASTELELADQDVHVWSDSVDDLRASLTSLERLLSHEEQTRANRYRFVADRELFVVCRGLLRILLAGYTRRDPRRLQFGAGSVGKPYLLPEEGISSPRFNVSHSHGRVLLGFSRDRELGVDVEQVRPIDDLDGLSKRYFAPQEQADLAARDKANRQSHFFTIWTLKEAYLKGTGSGLTTALDSFYVTPVKDASYPVRSADATNLNQIELPAWHLLTLPVIPGFAAAIAVQGDGWHLRVRPHHELVDLVH